MIEQMRKISLVAPASLGVPLFAFLQEDGHVHLALPEHSQADDGIVNRLLLLREKQYAIIEALGQLADAPSEDGGEGQAGADITKRLPDSFVPILSELEKSIEKFQQDLTAVLEERKALEAEKLLLERVLGQIRMPALSDAEGRDLSLWWGAKNACAAAVRQVERAGAGLLGDGQDGVLSHMHETLKEGQSLVELSVPAALAPAARAAFSGAGAHLWQPPQQCSGKNYIESLELIKRRLFEINRVFEGEKSLLRKLQDQWGSRQKAFFLLTDRELEQHQALNRCERVGHALIVSGWLPEKRLKEFKDKLEQAFEGKVAFFSEKPDPAEYGKVPTSLAHNKFFAPFEVFLKLVRAPAYGSTDPTVMIALFFPLFSGCIVGDAGYGLVMFLLMCFLRRRSKKKVVQDAAFILMTVCVWSLFWGAAFGEFFGDFAHRVFHLEPLWVERSQAVMPVLLFTVALGLAHILIGMVVGVVQGLRSRQPKHAMEKCGNILVILAMIAALMSVRKMLPPQAFPAGLALLVVGLILLMAGGGIGGLVESMSSFGHILSYVRIGAIGLSSAILAVAASKFVDVLGLSALGLFMALAIHLLNFVLAFAESSLHSARLHYVEFMGNFYVDKGIPYRPFTYRRNLPWKKDS